MSHAERGVCAPASGEAVSAALDRLSGLEAKATPGPWATPGSSTQLCYDIDPDVAGVGETGFGGVWNYADASLIVAARNALPALLAVAKAAEEFVLAQGARIDVKWDPDDPTSLEPVEDAYMRFKLAEDTLRAALAALDAP